MVCRQHDGDALGVSQRAQLRQEVPAGRRVEPGARLVEEQDGGPRKEPLGELDAAPEPPRQPLRELPRALGEPELDEKHVDALGELGTAQAVEPAVMAEVLLDGELAVDARVLEDDAEPAAHRVRRARHVVTEDAGGTAVGRQEGGEDTEEGALAATVRAEETEQLAARHGERHAGERLTSPEAAAQIYDLHRRRPAGGHRRAVPRPGQRRRGCRSRRVTR